MTTSGSAGPRSMLKYKWHGRKPNIQHRKQPLVEWHMLNVLADQGYEFDISRDNKSVPDPDQLYDALHRYEDHSQIVHDEFLAQAISSAYKVFGGHEQLEYLTSEYSIYKALKLEKSSGLPELKSKADAFERDWQRAQRVLKGSKRAKLPCVCYHRVQHGANGPKTRLVWGYPLSMTILEAYAARPLIQYFLEHRTAMAFGLLRQELVARMIPIENSNVRYGLDFSKFDATVKPELISVAFRILRSHFPANDEYWDVIENYFIHTEILMPDGHVYQKHQGVPSGSYFTQMIDSIVNYIVIQASILKVGGRLVNPRKILVLGDDSITGLRDYIPLPRVAEAAKSYGMNMNVEKSEVSRFGESISFLGHHWQYGIPHRDVKELLIRTVFPERIAGIDDPDVRRTTRLVGLAGDASEGAKLFDLFGISTRMLYFSSLSASLRHVSNGWLDHLSSTEQQLLPISVQAYLYGSLVR